MSIASGSAAYQLRIQPTSSLRSIRVNLAELSAFANEKLTEFGLYQKGWRFRFDRAKARFGCCRFDLRLITVSSVLTQANEEAECRDTVLHEIAHALAGRSAGHGAAWKKACKLVGAKPVRCYTTAAVKQPDPDYWGVCPHCDHRANYYKLPRTVRACRRCCVRYNGGRYDERFRLRILDARTGREVPHAEQETGRSRPALYVGTCPRCNTQYPFYRRQNFNKACASCCRLHAGGHYDPRFKLVISNVRSPV